MQFGFTLRACATGAVAALVLALLSLTARPSAAAATGYITSCQGIGCHGRAYLCGSYRWGGPNPGARDCYADPVVIQ
jgi:hypothetical protein